MDYRNMNKAGNPSRINKVAEAKPQLSCELCRDRKVKCDKLDPCTNCISHGVDCKPVQRLRLPRGRHAHRSKQISHGISEDINQRIHNLESLITDMRARSVGIGLNTGEVSTRQPSAGFESQAAQTNPQPSGIGIQTPASSQISRETSILANRPESFWENLAAEVHGLRDVVESALDGAEDDSAQALSSSQMELARGGMATIRLIGLSNPSSEPQGLTSEQPVWSLDTAMKHQLCQVYLRQVDPIIKILHRPSVEQWLIHGQGYFGYPEGHPTTRALSTAIYFSAASSLSEKQCETMFQMSRSAMAGHCRIACEMAIERSGLLATRDINVLEAFVLYLYGRRTEDRSKAIWTLIAVAVRVARGLNLHLPAKKTGHTESFFDQQMRLRLWLTICRMDMQSLFIQATVPLIGHEEVVSSLALLRNVNDCDFDATTMAPVENKESLTDMTFAFVSYHLQVVGRLLSFSGGNGKTDSGIDHDLSAITSDWETRQQYAHRFERDALQLLHFCDPESSVYAWFTWHGTHCLVAGIRLSVLRPIHGVNVPPPHLKSDTELLRMALTVLEKTQLLHTDPRGEGFRWYIAIPWHVVAIAIAECYVCTDAALIQRAWPVVEASYQQHESLIARYSGGLLRGPLGKLMRRTREKLARVINPGAETRVDSEMSTGGYPTMIPSAIPLGGNHPTLPTGIIPPKSNEDLQLMNSTLSPMGQYPMQIWDPTALFQETQTIPATGVLAPDINSSQEIPNESWKIWEDFVSDIPWEELNSTGTFFFENDLGDLEP